MMRRLAKALWRDECGFVLSSELVLVSTTVILGLTVGLVAVRDAISGEMNDLTTAFRSLDQSYYKAGVRGCRKRDGTLTSWTAGSGFFDPHLRTTGPVRSFLPEDLDIGGFAGEPCLAPTEVIQSQDCLPAPLPAVPVEPCLQCPEEVLPPVHEQMLPAPDEHHRHETIVPCLSCPPGSSGLLAPTPASALPGCSAPLEAGTAHFSPVIHPYQGHHLQGIGPLQVW